MPASTPLFLLLTALAAGIALALTLVPPSRTSRGYGQTMGLVALAALLAGLAYDAWFRLGAGSRPDFDGTFGMLAVGLHAVSALLWVGFLLRLRREPLPGPGIPAGIAVLSGLGVAVISVLALPAGAGGLMHALTAAGGLAGGAVLGTAMCAMLLGHFYLVVPGLSIDPFMRLSRVFLWVVVGRIALFGAAVLIVGPEAVWPSVQPSGLDPVGELLLGAVPLLMRVLFGLAGALLLAVMAVKTVGIRSTQSATGILYPAVVFVLIGEYAAGHLLVSAGLPL